MADSILSQPHFNDPDAAREYLEAVRWPKGPICPHCGSVGHQHYALQGKSTRPGVWKCADCREQFTVTVGTVFERSKIALDVWLTAVYLLCSSKKGISSHQLHRTLGVTYQTAWFMTHRIREAMRTGALAVPFGSGGGNVEIDETFVGAELSRANRKARANAKPKSKVLSLVDRTSGAAYSMVIDNIDWNTVKPILLQNISHEASVLTDEGAHYKLANVYFLKHETVNHEVKEYVRLSDRTIHTNTVEGYFSLFKRGMRGVYQHCGKQHLHRYLAEFDFRYSNRMKLGITDTMRADTVLKGISGKRLTYRRIGR